MLKNIIKILFLILTININSVLSSTKLQENFVSYYNLGVRYALLPIAKEILTREPVQVAGLEKSLEGVALIVGSRNFQGFPDEQLVKHKYDFVYYVLGRKNFLKSDYEKSESFLKKVSAKNDFYPMAVQVLATIAAIKKQEEKAQLLFDKCEKLAQEKIKDFEKPITDQYKYLSQQCLMGKARVLYGMKKNKEAESSYMELSKKSFLWPNILYEESWNSFEQKAYNRSLGKVATYKAPQLRYAYRPDVDVVRAMSYLEMCLYEDASETVDSFYKIYEPIAKYLEGTLAKYTKDPQYYFNLSLAGFNKEGPLNDFISGALKEPDTHYISENIARAKNEYNFIQQKFKGRAQDVLESTIIDYQESQKDLLGRLIRTKFKKFATDIREALQDMSFIKLEILGRKKTAIYQGKDIKGKRGDVEYLKRNRSQYFWTFKKEFWADELGDYVFALASECGNGSDRSRSN